MTSLNRLARKVAIVTGAASGIGQATARLFADEGATVAVALAAGGGLDILFQQRRRVGQCAG